MCTTKKIQTKLPQIKCLPQLAHQRQPSHTMTALSILTAPTFAFLCFGRSYSTSPPVLSGDSHCPVGTQQERETDKILNML